jgi:phenylpropionate dioxygenase-like ring-hydroxylating dioxygenase large terminal subunit
VPQGVDPLDPKLLSKCGGTSYVVAERQGLVWVWGEPLNFSEADPKQLPDEAQIPICEALEDDRFVWIDVSRDMPYSADMLLENVLEISHLRYSTTHEARTLYSLRYSCIMYRLLFQSPAPGC